MGGRPYRTIDTEVATGEGAAMATGNTRNQMRRQDTLNALGEFIFGFTVLLLLGAEFLFLNMLDDLVFHSGAPFTPGWIVWILLVLVVTVLVCRFIWIYRHGGDALSHLRSAASRKRAKRDRILFILCLSAILIATYGARFAGRSASMQSNQERAQETIGIISNAFEQAGFYVIGADAADVHDAKGYTVYCQLHADDWNHNSKVCLSVDNEGVVFEVDYHLDIQRDLTLEENLEQARNDLALMHDVVRELDIPLEVAGLASYAEIPEPLRQAFLSGSMYEEIIMNPDELGSSDGAYIHGAFWTSDEEDWSDATGAYLSIDLTSDW